MRGGFVYFDGNFRVCRINGINSLTTLAGKPNFHSTHRTLSFQVGVTRGQVTRYELRVTTYQFD